MKIDAFRKAQVIVDELDKIERITKSLKTSQTNVIIPVGRLGPETLKKIQTAFDKIEKDLHSELDKIT